MVEILLPIQGQSLKSFFLFLCVGKKSFSVKMFASSRRERVHVTALRMNVKSRAW